LATIVQLLQTEIELDSLCPNEHNREEDMAEEWGITMSEFKTVVESFRSDLKKVVEVINHRFDKMENEISGLKGDASSLKTDMRTVKQEIAFLHEGQTEIKAELRTSLKERVTYQDFNNLEKRVSRLERKTA
jgi:predicted  nucleic acid-binding Zn-ribbon protein